MAIATVSANFAQLNPLIDLFKTIVTFVGAMGIGSLITWRLQFKTEEKKQRREIAKEILSAVYAYNLDAINEWGTELELPKPNNDILRESKLRYVNAARRLNEAEALADLFVNEKAMESLGKIKKIVIKMFEEIKVNILGGDMKKDRHEMVAGQEYDKELKKLKNNLASWISHG